MQNKKKRSVLLGSSVTMTDCIMELNKQSTFFFFPEKILSQFSKPNIEDTGI